MSTLEAPLYADADDLIAAQGKQEKDFQQQRISDLKWLMGHRPGRRIVADLLQRTGQEQTSFTGNSGTFFNEGVRSVGLNLLSEVKAHCFDAYIQMLKESTDK